MEITISTNPIDWIEIISIFFNLLTSIVAIVISIKTLQQSNNAIIESSRANINFFVDTPTGGQYFLGVKNFGNSIGKVLNIDIDPKLDYSKSPKNYPPQKPIIEYKNILLAPGQAIKSWFPFSNYPDNVLNVTIEYETLGKIYKEVYSIDLSYIKSIDYIRKTSMDVRDEKQALVSISNVLSGISEKL